MIKRNLSPLDRFLAKTKDASRHGLKEIRMETKDAVELSVLLAQILLNQNITVVERNDVAKKPSLDGGAFR